MWIRTQDRKELVDITGKRLFVWDKKIFLDLCVREYDSDYEEVVLGKYSSKERALEILDEIETYIKYFDKKAYEMPKE